LTEKRTLLWAIAAYGLLYGIIHVFWFAVSPRYWLPLLPFALAILLVGIEGKSVVIRIGTKLLIASMVLVYAHEDIQGLRHALDTPASPGTPYSQTFSWISTHIPSGDILSSPIGPSIYLYTGHQDASQVPGATWEEWQGRLRQNEVRYVVFVPRRSYRSLSASRKSSDEEWFEKLNWAAAHRDAFLPVYINEAERTAVFKVVG
jgi:hypothetical protein